MSFEPRDRAIIQVLEQITREHPGHERNEARRVLSEVQRAWPGSVDNMWWRWLVESARSLGIQAKTLDCELREAETLVADGAEMACYRDGTWLAITSDGATATLLEGADDDLQSHSVSVYRLRSTLEAYAVEDQLRCVVLSPEQLSVRGARAVDGPMTPWDRLWQLLKPEASDIWLVVVFAFVVSVLMLASPIAVEALVNTVAFGRFLQPIIVLALILLTFLGFQGAIRALQTYVVEIIQRRLFARIAGDLAHRLPRAKVEQIDNEHAPELVNRFFDVVTVQKVAAQLMLDGLGLILSTFIGMVVLGFYHPWLLGFDLFLLFAIGMIVFVLGRGAVSSAVKESKHKYYMAAWLEDVARCQTSFHGDGGAEFAVERADRLIHNYLVARRKHFRIVLRQVLFALGLQAVASTVLLGLGGWLVVSGELTLGQLVAAELIVTVIVGAFAKFGKHMESFYDLLASADKLGVLFDLNTEREDGIMTLDGADSVDIQIANVSYAWPGHPAILSGLTARIDAGEHMAIVGPSGSGKSTLLDLIYGIRQPSSGRLRVNQLHPADLRPDVLRRHIGLARGKEVFHASIEENVHMHREGVTSSDVRSALEGVGVLTAVTKLAEGFDTMLTSGGRPLSDRQCELLGIARAAVARPGLLLIDGVLDRLGAEELDHVLNYLYDEDHPWTVVVTTSREDVACRFDRQLKLGDLIEPMADSAMETNS